MTADIARGPLWVFGTAELTQVLADVAAVRHQLAGLERRVVAEALERGLPGQSGASAVDWVVAAERAGGPDPGIAHAAQLVRLAAAQRTGTYEAVLGRVDDGDLSPGSADLLIRFADEVGPVADPVMLGEVMAALTEAASDSTVQLPSTSSADDPDHDGPRGTRRVAGATRRQLGVALSRARRIIKPAADLTRQDERYHRARALFVRPDAAGLTEYRWLLGPDGAAVVDAALSELAAPVPAEDGTPDPRSPAQRRSDALLALVQRAVRTPDSTLPSASAAHVVVTMDYERLVEAVRGVGVTATGHVLSPETVRRLACDAGVTPMVLGSDGAPLDVGRTRRLFTAAQRRALWERDRGCTFPGCTAPPAWTEAHHVVHWIRGGATDLLNAALLCGRHHRHVHSRDLTASVTATGVTWHT